MFEGKSNQQDLAGLSDSHGAGARLVRELYWNMKIPADLIGKAFALMNHRMKNTAGALIPT